MLNADVVVLAGGLGKRMQTELPKVLNTLHGKPMIEHVLEAIRDSGVCEKPVVVVGKKREMVMEALGDTVRYAVQEEQLGTGHALMCAEELLKDGTLPVLVLPGDMPNITSGALQTLLDTHTKNNADITLATVTVPDFSDFRTTFSDFGRIIREYGELVRIVEKKDATSEELLIHELNAGVYVFDPAWLWAHLRALKNENAQGEYYLTDVLEMAVQEGAKIATVSIEPKEAMGVNTMEHLTMLHSL